jgi:hypothetical protein
MDRKQAGVHPLQLFLPKTSLHQKSNLSLDLMVFVLFQDDIRMVMHESPLICPLMKIIPKASPPSIEPPSDDGHADKSKAEDKAVSSRFTLGKCSER